MSRFSAIKFSKVGLKVLKQSQKWFFSSAHDISPSLSLCPMSLLKARHDIVMVGITERLDLERKKFNAKIQKYDVEIEKKNIEVQKHDVEIQKYDVEIKYSLEKQNSHLKYFDEQLNLQLRNVDGKQNTHATVIQIGNDAVSKESLPTVSFPSLFKNEDDINDFCKNCCTKVSEITPEIAQKIAYVLRNYHGDNVRTNSILSMVHTGLYNEHTVNHSLIGQNLSAAGFGNALSDVLSAQSTNFNTIKNINCIFIHDYFLSSKKNTCAQDLYDAIDSPAGYNGAIFDTLLKILQSVDVECQSEAASIAYHLIDLTKLAKQFMIQKGFRSVVNGMSDNIESIEDLKQALNHE